MTIPEEETLVKEESYKIPRKPEVSVEWKDVTIEIKFCGKNIPDEAQHFVQIFPKVSDKLISASCIQERKLEMRQKQHELINSRPGSRIGNTLTELLEQNQLVNNPKGIKDESPGAFSPTPSSDISINQNNMDDDMSQKSDGSDLPENIDQLIDTKKLISLPNGGKRCHICGKAFTDTTRIKRHLLSHSDKKPFKCHLCGWGFHQKCNMERHLTSHTKEGEGHPCPRCNSWFTTKSVLSLHLKDAHNERYMGKKEVAAMLKKGELKQEAQESVGDESLYEPLELPFPNGPKKKRSWNASEDGGIEADQMDLTNLTCHICGKNFVKKTNLKHHLMLHRGEKPWKCDLCGWRFVQKCNLKKHIETHSTGTYKCPHCDIKFASKGGVSGHVAIKHFKPAKVKEAMETEEEEEAEIPAPSDPQLVESKKESSPAMMWWKHMESQETNNQPVSQKTTLNIPKVTPTKVPETTLKPIQCKTCPKTFSSKVELEKHMLVHNAEMKPYACPVCGLRFHLLHNMKRHLNTHEENGDIEVGTGDELLQTVEATKSPVLASPGSQQQPAISANVDGVISPQSLTSSIDTQEVAGYPGQYKCNHCNKWFSDNVALNRHMEIHSADRPHACPICGWRFKQLHNMKRHIITHSGAKPYSCDFCDKSYTDNYSLKQHVAKIHPDVLSSLPSMTIKPRNQKKADIGEDDGSFKSMINEMTDSQKTAALQLYQQQLMTDSQKTAAIQAYQQQMAAQSETMTVDFPTDIEPVSYEENDDGDMFDDTDDISQYMEEENNVLDDELNLDTSTENESILLDGTPVIEDLGSAMVQ